MPNMISRTDTDALMPEDVASEIIETVPQSSMVMKLGRKLPNMTRSQRRMAVLSVLPVAGFVNGDNGLKKTTRMAWANKYLNVEEIAAIVAIPDAVIDDSDYDIWEQVKPRLVEATGAVFDGAVVMGTDAPATWPTALVPGATAAGNTRVLGAGADIYDDILGEGGLISLVEEDGFMPTGHIAAVTMRGKLRGLRTSEGQPIFNSNMQEGTRYQLDGEPMEFDLQNVLDTDEVLQVSGDFRQLVYAIRQDITYTVSNQGVIQDSSGNIVYNMFQQDMTALRVVFRVAWQIPNPMNRTNSNDATRYPFAALLPS